MNAQIMNATATPTTVKADFYDYTNESDKRLFSVNEGLPVNDAILAAACLAESIKQLAEFGCDDSDLAAKLPYVFSFLADTVQALCNAAEAGNK